MGAVYTYVYTLPHWQIGSVQVVRNIGWLEASTDLHRLGRFRPSGVKGIVVWLEASGCFLLLPMEAPVVHNRQSG
ncbi:hypothetical protein GUJ93_ZPchr0006g44950 [Zizania palustris]|uniref:Uncharacterized protein n=1 Tax=Zizania palustris TaxID=103762 RepID=A0A8J5W398_ZIZPA|nr:hypothetical protein GUJ93_ZPchr0006g44950 [Zizania palustris]